MQTGRDGVTQSKGCELGNDRWPLGQAQGLTFEYLPILSAYFGTKYYYSSNNVKVNIKTDILTLNLFW